MTIKQLQQIKQFARSFYIKMDQYHDEKHAILTSKYALQLAKDYNQVDDKILEAACYLHDIGRTVRDEGHPYESAILAKPFLEKIRISSSESEEIIHAISIHSAEDIHKAKTIEAKLLFDADKMQILSVYGFLRVVFFLIEVRKMPMDKAIDFMWEYVQKIWNENILQTNKAKKILHSEMKEIQKIVYNFRQGLAGNLGS